MRDMKVSYPRGAEFFDSIHELGCKIWQDSPNPKSSACFYLGNNVHWRDANGKDQRLALNNSKGRRLLAYLLASDVRKPTALPSTFVAGLSTAYGANEDPATKNAASPTGTTNRSFLAAENRHN